jgi:succinate-semialdehyde dehydrogenase/glutarate-semialdehyde dehydrogenase
MLLSINPATDEIIREYKEYSLDEVNDIIKKVDQSFKEWKNTLFSHRSDLMKKAAQVLRNDKKYYSELMTLEMGKPILQSYAEVEKCAWVCDYYADNAKSFLEDEIVETDASKSFITYNPLGIVLAVMPWNFPFWQVFRFAAPALMAGNAGVLKHSSNVSGCALAIEEVFKKAGFPECLFRTLLIQSKSVEMVINNP